MNVAKQVKSLTLEEFETMKKDDSFNYELIDGVVMMSPSPSREHQRIEVNLLRKIGHMLDATTCEPLHELDIQFDGNVYKPDVMIFCDRDAELPEIIFEILSPSTRQYDLLYKLVKYQEMGIKEYWIVDPKMKSITVHDFVNATAETYGIGETIQSLAHTEIIVSVADIFAS